MYLSFLFHYLFLSENIFLLLLPPSFFYLNFHFFVHWLCHHFPNLQFSFSLFIDVQIDILFHCKKLFFGITCLRNTRFHLGLVEKITVVFAGFFKRKLFRWFFIRIFRWKFFLFIVVDIFFLCLRMIFLYWGWRLVSFIIIHGLITLVKIFGTLISLTVSCLS